MEVDTTLLMPLNAIYTEKKSTEKTQAAADQLL